MKFARTSFLAALAVIAATPNSMSAGQSLEVIVSIPPIHALVAGVMEGVGEPELLVPAGASPHSFSLKPSQARSLSRARLVVRTSRQLETFLQRPLENLARKADTLTLSEVKGMTLHEPREGGLWDRHDHHGNHDEKHHVGDEHASHGHENEHAHERHDPHIWLDPRNAARIAVAVSMRLQRAYPEYAAEFQANTEKLSRRLEQLDRDLLAATRPLRGKPYIVFHDAYRYFDERYKLTPVGAITVSPDRPTGARRLREIRKRIKTQKVACVFAEPQFQPKLVQTLISGTRAQAGTLDPVGANLAPGPDLYFKMMRNLASGMAACLKNPS